jgi:hypothetical protein
VDSDRPGTTHEESFDPKLGTKPVVIEEGNVKRQLFSAEKKQPLRIISSALYQELIRGRVTTFFVLMLAMLLLFAGVAVQIDDAEHWNRVKELLQIILPVLTTLLGSSLGFYFGANKKMDEES